METICPNVIIFGYVIEYMFENYLMKIFSHSDRYISKTKGACLDFSL